MKNAHLFVFIICTGILIVNEHQLVDDVAERSRVAVYTLTAPASFQERPSSIHAIYY